MPIMSKTTASAATTNILNACTIMLAVASVICSNGIIGVHADINITQFNGNDLSNQLPNELKTNLTAEDFGSLFRNKCIEVAGETNGTNAFKNIESGVMSLSTCIGELVNYTVIQSEIEKASPRGDLDVVFNKYCNKRPEAFECIESMNQKFTPCLDSDEQKSQDVFMRIIRSLLNFVCHKGGDQIALFIAEKGPECFTSKSDDIKGCFKATFSEYIPEEGFDNIKTLPKLVMGQKQCDDIQHVEKCIVEHLERCSEITPANIVESMFRFIRNETICRHSAGASAMQSASMKKNAAGHTSATYVGTLLAVLCLALVIRVMHRA